MRQPKISQDLSLLSDEDLEAFMRNKIETDERWAKRALRTLYDLQTPLEKQNPKTIHESDGKGFSPKDQDFLSSLAEQLIHHGSLSERQTEWLHKLLPKYAGQLVKIARATKAPEDFRPVYKFGELSIDNTSRTITGYSVDMGLSLNWMPSVLAVTNVSGDQITNFYAHEIEVGDPMNPLEEGDIIAYIFKGSFSEDIWFLRVVIGELDKSVPQWVEDMSRMIGYVG